MALRQHHLRPIIDILTLLRWKNIRSETKSLQTMLQYGMMYHISHLSLEHKFREPGEGVTKGISFGAEYKTCPVRARCESCRTVTHSGHKVIPVLRTYIWGSLSMENTASTVGA